MDYRSALIAQGIDAVTVEKFLKWHKENPSVWEEFKRLTLEAIARGKKVGAKAVMERVRWEVEIEKGGDWKANNSYTAYFARAFAIKYPLHKDYFEFREVSGLGRKAA